MASGSTHAAFERLHWRLMCAYVLVTVISTLAIGLTVMVWLTYVLYFTNHTPDVWVDHARGSAQRVAPLLGANPPNTTALDDWVKRDRYVVRIAHQDSDDRGPSQLTFSWYLNPEPRNIGIAVVDPHGAVVASTALGSVGRGLPLDTVLERREQDILDHALHDESRPDRLGINDRIGVVSAAAPVHDATGHVIGALFVRVRTMLTFSDWVVGFGSLVLSATLFMTCVAIVFGAAFSYLTSRGLTRRLQVIAVAAGAWSQGDFSPTAMEHPADELGALGVRLNGMARDLAQLFTLRQRLAAFEERNRLARDLHDTVKQQAFAAAMQVAAAREKIASDTTGAEERLDQAAAIVARMQQDLTVILRELSTTDPSSVSPQAIEAVRVRTDEWSRQSGIASEVDIRVATLPPRRTLDTLMRILDEALSNAMRHSGAKSVRIGLATTIERDLTFSIADDGDGLQARPSSDSGGMGLRTMRERAESLPSGQFAVETSEGGVQITVTCRVD